MLHIVALEDMPQESTKKYKQVQTCTKKDKKFRLRRPVIRKYTRARSYTFPYFLMISYTFQFANGPGLALYWPQQVIRKSVRGCSGQFRGPSRLSRGQQQRAHETHCSIWYLTQPNHHETAGEAGKKMAGLGVSKVTAIFV